MRWFVLLLAACSFRPGRALQRDADALADVGTADGPATPDAAPDAPPSPFAMSGMRWVIPCTAAGPNGPTSCTCAKTSSSYTSIVMLGGSAAEHWQVTIRITGAMEGLMFANGTPDATTPWYIGGDTGNDGGDNYYEIIVSSPSQHYYVNNAPSNHNYSVAFDYMATIPIDGNATVTFVASPQDMYEWQGVDMNDQPIAITGFTAPPPSSGRYPQWAYVTVMSALPR